MYVCKECKGENVELQAWVNPNVVNPSINYCSSDNFIDKGDTYCNDCEEHTGVEFVNEEEAVTP